jgi:copper(I)-binding protein
MKTFMKASLFILSTGLIVTNAHASGGMEVDDVWVREAPPNAKVMAAYMELENETDKKKVLVAVESNAFESVEIHRTEHSGDVARMIKQDKLEIPAGAEIEFKPGGLHLMLMGPKKPIKAGDHVEMTLVFEDGSKMAIHGEVRKGGHHDMMEHEGHHDHESMHEEKQDMHEEQHDMHSDKEHMQDMKEQSHEHMH